MNQLMCVAALTLLMCVLACMINDGTSLPLGETVLRSVSRRRLKRDDPRGNIYDPPIPNFPAKENAPFWNPAPYPFPTTVAPQPRVVHHKLPYYDPNNPYLDAMSDGYWPNFGLGYADQNPTLIGGGINWPTGNALMPSDHFNGTLGFARPQQLRVGMQGGPFFPYQNPQYIKTVKDISDANTLQQVSQVQSDARRLNSLNSVQGTPAGFIPVQQQLFAQRQQQQQQQQFFPRYQQAQQTLPQAQPAFSSFSNPFLAG